MRRGAAAGGERDDADDNPAAGSSETRSNALQLVPIVGAHLRVRRPDVIAIHPLILSEQTCRIELSN